MNRCQTDRRSYHWSRQLKDEQKRKQKIAAQEYSKRVAEIEHWWAIRKAFSYPQTKEIGETIEAKLKNLKNRPGPWAHPEGLSILQRLTRVERGIAETSSWTTIGGEEIKAICWDGYYALIKAEKAIQSLSIKDRTNVDNVAINGSIFNLGRPYYNGYTVAYEQSEGGYQIEIYTDNNECLDGKATGRLPPVHRMHSEDVKAITWPATPKAHHVISVELMNGDDVKIFAYHSQDAEQLALELKRLSRL